MRVRRTQDPNRVGFFGRRPATSPDQAWAFGTHRGVSDVLMRFLSLLSFKKNKTRLRESVRVRSFGDFKIRLRRSSACPRETLPPRSRDRGVSRRRVTEKKKRENLLKNDEKGQTIFPVYTRGPSTAVFTPSSWGAGPGDSLSSPVREHVAGGRRQIAVTTAAAATTCC